MQQPLKPYNQPDYNDLPAQFPPDCASAWGEDQYGVWFELSVKHVVQRFRWIPKGDFTMGSPEDEKQREPNEYYGKETLHEVSFTQGYWLADTACSQALWQSVMGNNPAEFDDDILNPVERVSWLDIQGFLKKLNQSIPNLKAQLPSEAQWEYACRAGVVSPFFLGDNIINTKVNFLGSPLMPQQSISKKRFKVALSFPGEHRGYIAIVADYLAANLGRDKVFYDKWYQAELIRPNLDQYLTKLYSEESDLLVLLLTKSYDEVARDVINQRKSHDIMPMLFDDIHIRGLSHLDGYLDLRQYTPRQVANLIMQRLQLNDMQASAGVDEGGAKTVPVTNFDVNDWGLYQMHGNVWEWCFDEFQEDLGSDSVVNPITAYPRFGVKLDKTVSKDEILMEQSASIDGTSSLNGEMLDNADGTRVLRGGSWSLSGQYCRSAIRNRSQADDCNDSSFGFRLSLGL